MRGKAHSDAKRAEVMAALLTGQSVAEVAAAYKLPYDTVYSWYVSEGFKEVQSKKGERVAELTFDYLSALLTSLTNQAQVVGTKEYILKQPASEIAVLHGVMADKGFRLLSAIPTNAGFGTDNAGTEGAGGVEQSGD